MTWIFKTTQNCDYEIFDEKGNTLLSCHYCEGGLIPNANTLAAIVAALNQSGFTIEAKVKGNPQDTDPHAPHYFAPYDDMGNKRTINNAVDCGWAYPTEEERKIRDKVV